MFLEQGCIKYFHEQQKQMERLNLTLVSYPFTKTDTVSFF